MGSSWIRKTYDKIRELKKKVKTLSVEKNDIFDTLTNLIIDNKKAGKEEDKIVPAHESIFSEQDPPYQPQKNAGPASYNHGKIGSPSKTLSESEEAAEKNAKTSESGVKVPGWLGASVFPFPSQYNSHS